VFFGKRNFSLFCFIENKKERNSERVEKGKREKWKEIKRERRISLFL